ncbi:MAG: MATE family efflux transporter [Oscillospiraceae bacterium]|nr:MATE family efflux transporter [Oscillospiraceae bacterium]
MSKNLNMTKGHPAGLLVRFALPLMFGNVFQQLYTVVDTAIVGKGIGMEALAALGTVDWLNWMFLGVVQGLTQGFAVKMSQRFGQGDEDGLKQAIGVSAMLSVYITMALLLVGQLCLPLFLILLKVPDELKSTALLYSRVIFGGVPATMFFNFCASALRAVGDGKTPLYSMITASVANIVLDLLAVYVLHWGVAGAAIATVLAQCLAGAVCAWKIYRSPLLRFEKRHLAPDRALSRDLLALGTPLALQNSVIAIGGMAVQTAVNLFGTAFIAGYTASNKLYGILEIAAVSYGFAITTYTGQNYGADNWQRIRSGVNWSLLISVITAVIIAGSMLLFGRPITMLFIESDSAELTKEAGDTAYFYLSIMSVNLPVLYILYTYRSVLQGIGNTVVPLISGIMEFVIRVGTAVAVSFTLYSTGIFIGEVGAWYGAAVLLAVAYYVIIRKKNPAVS